MHCSQRVTSFFMPSAKNSGLLFLIHVSTALLTSSSDLKWTPLISLLRYGKKWKSLGARSRLYVGWGRTLRISADEEPQAWHARCAVVHCHEAAKSALSTFELGILSDEAFEASKCNVLNSLCLQLPDILSDRWYASPKRPLEEFFGWWHGFEFSGTRRGRAVILRALTLFFGIKMMNQDSSPVTILSKKSSPSSL